MTTPTATNVITGEQALELLRQVVAEAGETFVDRTPVDRGGASVYTVGGKPCCLVGHALVAAGASIEDLDRLQDRSIDAVLRVGRLWLEWDAAVVFNVAQLLQDEGTTWGAALQAASDVFDRLDHTLALEGVA
jgi:hypothetical protein